MKPRICITLAALLWAATVPAREPAGLAFPAHGLLDTGEGTLEVRVRIGFDRSDDVGRDGTFRGQGEFLQFNYGDLLHPDDNWRLSFFAGKWGTGAGVRIGKTFEGLGVRHPFFPSFGSTRGGGNLPVRGGWYTLAIVWREGHRVTTYVDGVPSAGRNYPESIERALSPRAWFALLPGPYALEFMRISSVARSPDDLALGPVAPEPDEATLFLLDFRGARPGDTTLVPTHAATPGASQPVEIPAPFALHPSPGGMALYAAPLRRFEVEE
jgi:hypothetical protein